MFIKTNPYDNDSLIKESRGLELLDKYITTAKNCHLNIPHIYSVTKQELTLEKIIHNYSNKTQMEVFGYSLAKLHQLKFNSYGLDYDNFIGLSEQKNIISNNWGDFFFEYRLLFQVEKIENKIIREDFLTILYKQKEKIINFLNTNTDYASIVHGDLWSGNVLFSNKIYLIDPAVYFADREVDIAMTQLFGGFSSEFYKIYSDTLPLSKEYNNKKIIYNTYHYLNHYNLFGLSYLNDCKNGFSFIDKLFT
ncbi:fructosamine kinase family protein [Halarcobacter sp.]|uniref:fructosamine kinase family protein n=1 Tax=Halarcobacter sp. TaxID=2321133 RepID=UPI0029F53D7D|nr:fructosamine kinase family protein [Halarcobacter sp.]